MAARCPYNWHRSNHFRSLTAVVVAVLRHGLGMRKKVDMQRRRNCNRTLRGSVASRISSTTEKHTSLRVPVTSADT